MFSIVQGETIMALPVCEPKASLFLRLKAVRGVSPAWLCSEESRTESSGPNDPAVKNTEIFPLVLETRPVRRKPMGRWKEFKRKDCQIILNLLELLRVEEHKWEDCFCEDFCPTSNCILFSPLTLSLCPLVYLFPSAYLGLPGCLSLCQAGCQSVCSLVHPAICVWICSHAANSSAHWWCWHLLWDPGRW